MKQRILLVAFVSAVFLAALFSLRNDQQDPEERCIQEKLDTLSNHLDSPVENLRVFPPMPLSGP
jgi:hypothetical protein